MLSSPMVPAGYLLKRIGRPPDWLKGAQILDIYSVSDCVNDDLVDLKAIWAHNTFGVANAPEVLWRLAREGQIDTSEAQLLFYEAYELEIESEDWLQSPPPWRPLTPLPSGTVASFPAVKPDNAVLVGYDVVVCEDFLEHSPLSCNGIARSVPVNAHCLFDTLEQAKTAIESGGFNNCEPGIYRIYSVSVVQDADRGG